MTPISSSSHWHTELMAEDPTTYRWEDWTWDGSVFEGTAAYYRQGRKPYSPKLAEALATHLSLDGEGRLLDVGCGPGSSHFCSHTCSTALSVSTRIPEWWPRRCAAAEEGIDNTAWIRMRAEELPASLGSFQVVSFGQSFHWMDRPRVAAAVRDMLDPGARSSRLTSGIPAHRTSHRKVGHTHRCRRPPSTSYAGAGSDLIAGRDRDFRDTSPNGRTKCSRAPALHRNRSSWCPTTGSSRVQSMTSWLGFFPRLRPRPTSWRPAR